MFQFAWISKEMIGNRERAYYRTMIIQPWGMCKNNALKDFMKKTFIELFKKKLTIVHWGGNDENALKKYVRETLKV